MNLLEQAEIERQRKELENALKKQQQINPLGGPIVYPGEQINQLKLERAAYPQTLVERINILEKQVAALIKAIG